MKTRKATSAHTFYDKNYIRYNYNYKSIIFLTFKVIKAYGTLTNEMRFTSQTTLELTSKDLVCPLGLLIYILHGCNVLDMMM